MNRTLNVVRMQFINRQTFVWVPLIVLGGAFVLSLIVYALIPTDDIKVGGGWTAPLWYFVVIGVQALTLTFPFSQAMSVTRREFFFGTLLSALVSAVMLSTVFAVGGLVEIATHGWGLNGYFFYIEWMWAAGPLGAFVINLVSAMLLFVGGFWAATIYKRFGAMWLTLVFLGIGALIVGAVWIVGFTNAWVGLFTWIAESGALGLAAWGLVLATALAGISFLLLRRATP